MAPRFEVVDSEACGCYCGNDLEQRVDSDALPVGILSAQEYRNREHHEHDAYYRDVDAENVVFAQGRKIALYSLEYRAEIYTAKEHEHYRDGLDVYRVVPLRDARTAG